LQWRIYLQIVMQLALQDIGQLTDTHAAALAAVAGVLRA
jgi:hypothetical protein